MSETTGVERIDELIRKFTQKKVKRKKKKFFKLFEPLENSLFLKIIDKNTCEFMFLESL